MIDAPERKVIIDGGPNKILVEKLSEVMPFWDRSIDLIVNTHPHADHLHGFNHVLERYDVEEVWHTGQIYGTDTFKRFEELSKEKSQLVKAGDVYDLGGGAMLTVVFPQEDLDGKFLQDPNAGSIVLLLEYGETTMLFTGDTGVEEERLFLGALPELDILQAGHHGSKTSTSEDLVRRTRPKATIISVGKNKYGHPHKEVLSRLRAFGVEVFRTDEHGDIRIRTTGGEPEVVLQK